MAKSKFKNDIALQLLKQHITVDKQGLLVVIKVKPNSAMEKLYLSQNNELTLAVRAEAMDNKANERVIEIMADIFAVSKSQILITTGKQARTKRILIIDPDKIFACEKKNSTKKNR